MEARRKPFFLIFIIALLAFFLLGINLMTLLQSWRPGFCGTGLVAPNGAPVRGDFVCYYAASSLALSKQAAKVYDVHTLREEIKMVVGKEFTYDWWYPPTFLMLVIPLAALPYFSSLLVWLSTSFLGYAFVLLRIAPHPLTILLIMAFPGAFINVSTGQNGFLSAVLLGGGLLLINRYPKIGGALLGIISFKPHLAILIPLALSMGRRWQALATFCISAIGLILASIMVLGYKPWLVFLGNFSRPAYALQGGSWPWERMPTVFAAVFLMGGGSKAAWLIQGVVMVGVTLTLARVWHKSPSSPANNAILVLAILLFTPYAFYYDLAILALPIAWIAWQGYQHGWDPVEAISLTLAFLSPFLMYLVIHLSFIKLALTPIMLIILFLLAIRSAKSIENSQSKK